jgi:TetR/AcrR family transcriptional regulator, tetracycline repressor protein
VPNPKKTTRKTREPLSVKLIHDKALELIERDGLEALSMRSLATALRVDPMAIYHHIPNKAALMHGVHNSVMAELFESDARFGTWQEDLKSICRRYRALALRHAKIFPSLIVSSKTTENELKAFDQLLVFLLEAGVGPEAAIQAADSLFAFVTGFALLELNVTENAVLQAAVNDVAQRTATPFVHMTRLSEQFERHPFGESFEFGLALLIRGIEASILEPRPIRRNSRKTASAGQKKH